MATIKNTTQALGNLINTINGMSSTSPTNSFPSTFGGGTNNSSSIGIDDDSIPANMLDMQPEFEINYKSTKKQCIKKAKSQLEKIVKEVVPSMLQNSLTIIDKIQQDSEQLGALYYEYEKTELVSQSLMNTISRGETQARLFEVYGRMSKMQQELAVQITEMQNQMRKYYIDTYLDLQQKDESEQAALATPADNSQKALPGNDNPNVIVGTDQISKMLAEKKKKALIAQYEEAE